MASHFIAGHRMRGFTLLELLVVIVIIGLLAAFVVPKYFGQIQCRIDTGHYPSTELRLAALLVQPANEPSWHDAYLKKGIPRDPWGNSYSYKSPGAGGRGYEIVYYGADGQQGGAGEGADIANWN